MPIECRQTEKRPCRHHRQIGFASVFPYMGLTFACQAIDLPHSDLKVCHSVCHFHRSAEDSFESKLCAHRAAFSLGRGLPEIS